VFWLTAFAGLSTSLVREHLDQLQEDIRVTLSVRTGFIGYAWRCAAFALVLAVAMPFDATHVGDILNVAVALGGTLGVAYLHREPVLPTSVWRGLSRADCRPRALVTILLVISTGNEARGFHRLLGSTGPGSKA
jgi:hypothetical protein